MRMCDVTQEHVCVRACVRTRTRAVFVTGHHTEFKTTGIILVSQRENMKVLW